jgi:hypothetical protein
MKTTYFHNSALDKHGVDVITDSGECFGIACPDEKTARTLAARADQPIYTKLVMANGLVYAYYRVKSQIDIFSIRLTIPGREYPSCGDTCLGNALSDRHQVISQKEFAAALKEFKKLVRLLQP